MDFDFPKRIVCLTEETTETLYLLGQDWRIVGVSGYTARPPEARQKPKVSAFIHAKFDRIVELRPDLILAFSDLQGEIVRELLTRGLSVLAFNQRSIGEIEDMIVTLARITGVHRRGVWRWWRNWRRAFDGSRNPRRGFCGGLASSSRNGTIL